MGDASGGAPLPPMPDPARGSPPTPGLAPQGSPPAGHRARPRSHSRRASKASERKASYTGAHVREVRQRGTSFTAETGFTPPQRPMSPSQEFRNASPAASYIMTPASTTTATSVFNVEQMAVLPLPPLLVERRLSRDSGRSSKSSHKGAEAPDLSKFQTEWGGGGFGTRTAKESVLNLRADEFRDMQGKGRLKSKRQLRGKKRERPEDGGAGDSSAAQALAGLGGTLCEGVDHRSKSIFGDYLDGDPMVPVVDADDLQPPQFKESLVIHRQRSLRSARSAQSSFGEDLSDFSAATSAESVLEEEARERTKQHQIDLDQLAEQLLAECDVDGSGFIDAEELRQALPRLGVQFDLTEEQCDKIIKQVDKDGNGLLDIDELRLLVQAFGTIAEHGVADRDENEFVNRVFDLIDKIQSRGGAQNNIANRLAGILGTKAVLTPDSLFRRCWEIVSLALMFYYWVSCSVTLAFDTTSQDVSLLMVDLLATAVHVADLVIHLNTAVQDSSKTRPIVDKRAIFLLYARFYLWMDLLCILPVDVLLWYTSTAFAWRLSRFRKVLYVSKWRLLFKVHDRGLMPPDHVRYYFYVVPVLKTITRMVFLAHAVILIRASISHNDHYDAQNCTDLWMDVCEQSSWADTYYYAAWWVWWQITSQGQIMVSLEAHILAVLVMCVCVLVQSQVMAEMSALLVQGNIKQRNDEAMRELRARMRHFGIPFALQQEVLSFNFHTLGGSSAVILKQYLHLVPEAIIQEVFLYIKITVVEGVHMFANVTTECTMALANCLLPQYADPDEMIIPYGSLGTEMYFLMYGHADVMIPLENEDWLSVAVLKQGDLFGEVALLKPHIRRTANVQALGFCDLFVLIHSDFDPVQKRYEELGREMATEARRRGLILNENSDGEGAAPSVGGAAPELEPAVVEVGGGGEGSASSQSSSNPSLPGGAEAAPAADPPPDPIAPPPAPMPEISFSAAAPAPDPQGAIEPPSLRPLHKKSVAVVVPPLAALGAANSAPAASLIAAPAAPGVSRGSKVSTQLQSEADSWMDDLRDLEDGSPRGHRKAQRRSAQPPEGAASAYACSPQDAAAPLGAQDPAAPPPPVKQQRPPARKALPTATATATAAKAVPEYGAAAVESGSFSSSDDGKGSSRRGSTNGAQSASSLRSLRKRQSVTSSAGPIHTTQSMRSLGALKSSPQRNPQHHPLHKPLESPCGQGTRCGPRRGRKSIDARHTNTKVREIVGPLYKIDTAVWALVDQLGDALQYTEPELEAFQDALAREVEDLTRETQAKIQHDLHTLNEKTEALSSSFARRLQNICEAPFPGSGATPVARPAGDPQE